ncbi:hypothetical protein EKD16_18430 [Streptomonospora litoralis]|uniref:Integrase catalytic domain-containing protein n=1 Tax=Streptomonospora litoralis TaxID=2498135 RepID=A0A4P6Q593_9ACTN|nr:hypothetical protein EKD16_18430 [Streptomonospora litoralis]
MSPSPPDTGSPTCRRIRRCGIRCVWPRTVNGYYKTEPIRGPSRAEKGLWKSVKGVEAATLGWVHWPNTQRLHGYLGDLHPTEYEAPYYAAQRTDRPLVGMTRAESSSDRAVHPT